MLQETNPNEGCEIVHHSETSEESESSGKMDGCAESIAFDWIEVLKKYCSTRGRSDSRDELDA